MDAALVDALAAVRSEIPMILAHDPGSGSTGLALLVGDRCVFSTQGSPDEVAQAWHTVAALGSRIDVFAREAPYIRVRERNGELDGAREVSQARALYTMGFAAGWVSCALRREIRGAVLWTPLPSTWRAVLGLNRKKSAGRSARDETNEAVWLWAKATTRLPLVGDRGGRCYDEANAIALGYAALAVLKSARASA